MTTPNSGANTTRWSYDAFGRLQRENRPDGTYTGVSVDGPFTGADPRMVERISLYQYGSDNVLVGQSFQYRHRFERPILDYVLSRTGTSYTTVARGYS